MWRKAASAKALGESCACLLEQHEGVINAQAQVGAMENEYKGHIMWGLGDHNRKSIFPLSGTGAP